MLAALYSRKSIFTGKGESIENQIFLCRDYAEKYLNITDFIIYEDEGYSGSNTNRPKFQELVQAIKSKKINVLICYRLDRISRNVADFSSMLQLLQDNNVEFVSIKEQFDTTTPMGRAMVYISSVFAQLERETIAERVRDNMLQLAKTGRWLGGQEPYGFLAERVVYYDEELKEKSLMKLTPIENELNTVKCIFNKYIELQSITQVVKYINLAGIKGKNHGDFATMQVGRILSNPLYVKSNRKIEDYLKKLGLNVYGEPNGEGYLTYNKTKNITKDRHVSEWIAAIGKHPGVIEAETWLEVQKILNINKDNKIPRLGTSHSNALFTGILKCSKCNSNMIIKQGHLSKSKSNLRYDYYVCGCKERSYGLKCKNKNIRVDILDNLVVNELNIIKENIFLEELANAINRELAKSNFQQNNDNDAINDEIKSKEQAINNLVKQLSLNKSEEVAKYIFSEIEALSNRISTLKESLLLLNPKQIHLVEDENYINLISYHTIDFEISLSLINNMQFKRTLLRTLVSEILWDGEDKTIKIFFASSV